MPNNILEKNGSDVTNIDGARFNRFCAGFKDGIIKKSFSECDLTFLSSNVINIAKGELLISGFRVIVTEQQITFSTFPSSPIRYQIVAKLIVDADHIPSFGFEVRGVSSLTQENVFENFENSRTYEIELGRFTANIDGLTELTKTIDTLSGYGEIDSNIKVGEVYVENIESGLKPEVDINERYNEEDKKTYWDISFKIPKGEQGVQGSQGPQGPQGVPGVTFEYDETTKTLTISTE